MYEPMHRATRPAAAQVFNRPGYRVWLDLIGVPTIAAAFLGVALLAGIGAIEVGGLIGRVAFVLGLGFFGLLMASGIPATFRRGTERAVLEVGPEGIWMPEMGFLRWSEVAEVRLERVRGSAGEGLADYPKIGIVPRDPARAAAVRRSLLYRMVSAFMGLMRTLRPDAGLQDPDSLAPFGIYGYELISSVGSVVDAIREYHEIRLPDGSLAERLTVSA